MSELASDDSGRQRQWFIVQRWQAFDGELRANLLRIIAIGAFYGVQLLQFHVFAERPDDERVFHRAATALAVAGTLVGLSVLLLLKRRMFPAGLKFATTVCDVLLITCLAIVGNQAQSPAVLLYFLVIGLAALRFSLPLIWCATIGCLLGYLVVLGTGDPTWFDADHVVPPAEQLMMLLSLTVTGIMMGQIVRRAGSMADDFASRLHGN